MPAESAEADEENRRQDGKTLLYVFGRGYKYACPILLHMKYIRTLLMGELIKPIRVSNQMNTSLPTCC